MSIYSSFLNSALIPGYYGSRGRLYPKYRALLEQSQWWSPDQMQQFQWRELRRLLTHAFRTVPYYRKKYAAAGIDIREICTPEDFAKLPPLTRPEVNAYREELCSAVTTTKLVAHATGGSSGIPTRFFITLDSYDWRCAASERAYSWSGHRIGERTMYLWGAVVGKVSRFEAAKMNAYRLLRRELVVPTFTQTIELWRRTLRNAVRFRPRFIVGYVSSLEEFAQFLLAEGTRLHGIQAVIAAAEAPYERTRQLVAQAFGAPLFNTYGTREFMSIAAECDQHQGLHINSDNLLVETEVPSSKGPSELLVTDLHNYGMPFIRYRVGDTGILSNSTCPCGRRLPLIRSVEGRVLDVLRTRDGKVVPGEFFPHVLKDISEVREFQVQQTSLDEIVVYVVLNCPLSGSSRALLKRETTKFFGNGIQISIQAVEHIPRQHSGKRRITVGLQSRITTDMLNSAGPVGR
jgi:phenylacetate-coenzyme A ligase PaaK-like adenylate-forming protein